MLETGSDIPPGVEAGRRGGIAAVDVAGGNDAADEGVVTVGGTLVAALLVAVVVMVAGVPVF